MCKHRWRKVFEEFLLGGMSPIGYECVDCKEFISNNQLTPAGLGGIVLENSARLVAPCGGRSKTSSGEFYREQIIDEYGKLTIIE
jgi:hypothetical protein